MGKVCLPIPKLTQSEIDRFWSKVDVKIRLDGMPDECWEWKASRDRDGYGNFKLRGKMLRANRVAECVARGVLPGDAEVLHSCDNPPCCNPAHTRRGCNQANMDDKVERGRQASGAGLRESTGTRKLTSEQVAVIQERYVDGRQFKGQHNPDCGRALAKEFAVSTSDISLIVNRRIWNEL